MESALNKVAGFWVYNFTKKELLHMCFPVKFAKLLFIVIPSFSFSTPRKMTQNSFTTSRQTLVVLFILIFISIIIYTSLFTLICLYLFTLTYLYLCIFSLCYYVNLIKLLKYGKYRN